MAKPKNSFQDHWGKVFGDVPPLGHHLRCDLAEHWTRFHALPKSNRYPRTPEEKEIIRDRANVLGDQLFVDGEKLWLAITDIVPNEQTKFAAAKALGSESASDWTYEDISDDDIIEYVFNAATVTWRSGAYDYLFDEVASDRVRALFFDPTTKTVLAPYGGGFDVICSNTPQRLNLERKFQRWMSKRPDKL